MQHVYLKTYRILEEIVRTLAVGPGDIKSRLHEIINEVSWLDNNNFPNELSNDWNLIILELTKYGERKPVGAIENTINRIRRNTGMKIAEKIFDLKEEMENYLN